MKKKFYCLISENPAVVNSASYKMLETACLERNIDFVALKAPKTAYALQDVPVLDAGGLYRLSTGYKRLTQYAYALRRKNPQLKTWYISDHPNKQGGGIYWNSVIDAELQKIPVIPTLFGLTNIVTEGLLDTIQSQLDGFPVIVKMSGMSHGKGVMLVESAEALKSLAGHIVHESNNSQYVIRKFIPNAKTYRAIVLNEKCISTTEYGIPAGDFRSNATKTPEVRVATLAPEIEAIAVQATHALGVLFGGVDILIGDDEQPYIAEINTPCNFSRNQLYTGQDIAGQIVDFLAG